MAKSRVLLLCSLVLALGSALPTESQDQQRRSRNAIQTENDLLDSVHQDCLKKDSAACLKYKLFSFVDKMLGHKDTITLTDGVQIIKTGSEKETGAPRALDGDETIEGLILSRIQSFFESHTIKVDLKGADLVNAVSSTARTFSEALEDEATEEGRGKKNKKGQKMMGAMMAAAALKAALLGKLALAAIAVIAGKALLIGKIALVLSAIIGLKSLMKQSNKQVTYEVVQHPQHSSSHVSSHETVYGGGGSGGGGGYGGDIGGGFGGGGGGSSGHGGWGRSLDAQQLAYRAQPQASQQ